MLWRFIRSLTKWAIVVSILKPRVNADEVKGVFAFVQDNNTALVLKGGGNLTRTDRSRIVESGW